MVRTSRPLVERMTLVWHDWFATSNGQVGLAAADAQAERALPPPRPRLVPRPPARRHARPRDADLPLGRREHEGRAERELRPRADGALHARRGPRLHRARRARAGARPDRLGQRLEERDRPDELPLPLDAARQRGQDDLRQEGPLRLARLVPPLPRASEPRLLCRAEALELLRARAARRRHAGGARAALQGRQLRDQAARRRDPPPPGALPRACDGEAACRLHRRPPARARARDRHRRLGLARRRGRAAAVLPAERRGLGRLALARHRHLPRPLGRGRIRPAPDPARTRTR